ncbi:conserved hypothetical protein [Sporisorium reilianum SRZ2]|uniref:Uncharacterized protein n=1 Tax=Sporisorium reilianum (strain SRZ2) TaxID=999809 RepID=E6ZQT6_SPORE|nr:conserved hypothetical protein [Sporisorium reilianum SRZ2]
MSAPLLARQHLLRGQAASAFLGLNRINPATSAAVVARGFHVQPNRSTPASSAAPSKRWPLKTLGGGLMAAGGGGFYLGSDDQQRTFSVYAPLESEADSSVNGSSTLMRPASPAAPRRQTVALVFLTSQSAGQGLVKSLVSNFGGGGGEREKWFPWIGYFREAGYDCVQMNLALPSGDGTAADKTTARLADELHTQIRLSNLQRQPVLFVHHAADASPASTAQIVSSYIEPNNAQGGGGGFWSKIFGGGGMFGSRPAISGLVVISDLDDASALTLFGKHPKLNMLIVANGGASTAAHQGKVTVMDAKGKKDDKIIKDIERWLIKEGYEG